MGGWRKCWVDGVESGRGEEGEGNKGGEQRRAGENEAGIVEGFAGIGFRRCRYVSSEREVVHNSKCSDRARTKQIDIISSPRFMQGLRLPQWSKHSCVE